MWTGQAGALMTMKSWIIYSLEAKAFWRASAALWRFGKSTDFQSKKKPSVVRCSSEAANLTADPQPIMPTQNSVCAREQQTDKLTRTASFF